MKSFVLSRNSRCFLLILILFLWTSCGYLSWLYRLMALMDGTAPEWASEVIGYLLQALGLLAFSLAVRRKPGAAGKRAFALAAAADYVLVVLTVLVPGRNAVLLTGYAMNLMHGILAGFYLYRLALMVEWPRRGLVFGLAYGGASVLSWLLSLPGNGNFLRSRGVLIVYGILAAATLWCIRTEQPLPMEKERFDGEKLPGKTILMAAGTVFLLSLVKGLGFSFPSADISRGISLELSRVFYAVGLVTAGLVSDRERKYGAICCVASLGVPFLMISASGSLGPSVVFWVLNYILFGFFTIFRVILFTDIGRKDQSLLWLSGVGLLFGRAGDAAGTICCLTLINYPLARISVAAVLFAGTILCFFLLYQRLYLPPPIHEKSEQERFAEFSLKYDLSLREQEVLRLILSGQSSPEIAESLYVSGNTVKYHVRNLLKKTSCENRVSLVALFWDAT